MDTFFGKRKTRPRQSSVSDLSDRAVPYHKLAPPQKSPVAGGQVPIISAPMTNPTLTANGTELNKFAIDRQRQLREQAYRDASPGRPPPPGSPTASISTAGSSSLYGDTESSRSRPSTSGRRYRESEAAYTVTDATSTSGATSPRSMTKSFDMPSNSRPTSTIVSPGLEGDRRSSRHVPTLSSFDSRHSHLSNISSHLSRFSDREEFVFPRPSDEEIEALFEGIRRDRGLPEIPLSMDQKWSIVHSDEQLRWKEERDQAKRQNEFGSAASAEQTPEWYLRRFLDGTITLKQATGLQVSLRGKEVRCVPDVINGIFDVRVHVRRSSAGSKHSLNYGAPQY